MRDITNACAIIPVEVPGVLGVAADGVKGLKSFYSSYGVGTVTVVAPGGDSNLQTKPVVAPNGRVLSTYPPRGRAFGRWLTPPGPRIATCRARRWRRHMWLASRP